MSNKTLSCSVLHKGEGDQPSKADGTDFRHLVPKINGTPHPNVLAPCSSRKQYPDENADSHKQEEGRYTD
jgi:hypothetical protein